MLGSRRFWNSLQKEANAGSSFDWNTRQMHHWARPAGIEWKKNPDAVIDLASIALTSSRHTFVLHWMYEFDTFKSFNTNRPLRVIHRNFIPISTERSATIETFGFQATSMSAGLIRATQIYIENVWEKSKPHRRREDGSLQAVFY